MNTSDSSNIYEETCEKRISLSDDSKKRLSQLRSRTKSFTGPRKQMYVQEFNDLLDGYDLEFATHIHSHNLLALLYVCKNLQSISSLKKVLSLKSIQNYRRWPSKALSTINDMKDLDGFIKIVDILFELDISREKILMVLVETRGPDSSTLITGTKQEVEIIHQWGGENNKVGEQTSLPEEIGTNSDYSDNQPTGIDTEETVSVSEPTYTFENLLDKYKDSHPEIYQKSIGLINQMNDPNLDLYKWLQNNSSENEKLLEKLQVLTTRNLGGIIAVLEGLCKIQITKTKDLRKYKEYIDNI